MSTTGSDKKDLKRKDAAGKKKVVKAKEEPKAETKTRKRGSGFTSFKVSIRRLLNSLHPDAGVSKNGMSVLNSFAHDIYEKLATEGSTLMKYQKAQTLSGSHILGAIKLVLPTSIAEVAITEAKKAETAYTKAAGKH